MATESESPTGPGYCIAKGLFDFYSSQAKVMLAQYQNINQLLGPTNDWTAPGTLCEVLARDLIRRVLPDSYSVDKGFVFGRRMKGDREVHSPEIDVLIHDSHNYAPVYRLDDFVIVRPKAVRGVIQVKRTLDGGQLYKAVRNLVDAKAHLRAFRAVAIPNTNTYVFSAALFFGDTLAQTDGSISQTYEKCLRRIGKFDSCVRPHFLGSLANRYYALPFDLKHHYEGYPSMHSGGNVALATFLGYLTQCILPSYSSFQFYRPADHLSDQKIELDQADRPSTSNRRKPRTRKK